MVGVGMCSLLLALQAVPNNFARCLASVAQSPQLQFFLLQLCLCKPQVVQGALQAPNILLGYTPVVCTTQCLGPGQE